MAAFYITGVDNVIVEIDNIELPIMDGSSKEFIKIINQIGLIKQSAKRKFLRRLLPLFYRSRLQV